MSLPEPVPPEEIKKINEAFATWKGGRWCGHPSVCHSYEKTMHWKIHDQGTGFIEFRSTYRRGLEIDASESPNSGRGAKRVMLDLPPEKAKELRDLLLMLHPLEK